MATHSRSRAVRTGAEARYRLLRALSPRASRAQLAVAVLFLLLGFVLTSAVRSSDADKVLANARQSDLVSILDDLAQRQARLESELAGLESARAKLLGGDQYQAIKEAESRAAALAVLAGTDKMTGNGLTVQISGNLTANTMIDAIQELRAAGATAIQVSDNSLAVRVVVNTWFADSADGITVSNTSLKVPITLTVLGDPSVLKPALEIPGGLVDTIGSGGGTAQITTSPDTRITAVAVLHN